MTPRGRKAPKDWPAEPVKVMSMVSSGRPAPPNFFVTSWPSMVPTVRLMLRIGDLGAHRLGVGRGVGGQGVGGELDQLVVERLLQAVVLLDDLVARGALGQLGHVEERRQVQALRLPVVDGARRRRALGVADGLLDGAEAQLGEDLADLLGDELEEVDDVLGLAGEPLAQHRVLGGDADRAGVQVADAHHDAAGDDERRGRETELLGAEQRGDDDVAAGLELAVGLHDDAVAQAVEQQGLLGLGEAELPGAARVLERGQRGGAGAAVVAGDQHDVRVRLGDTRGDRADADLGDQLHVDARLRVGVLEVVDQLGEVLDGVDVVVRRRGDQADARRRVPGLGDPRVDLVAGQLAALAGLGALGHLDLDVVGVDQVLAGHAEAAGGDLLDGASGAPGRTGGPASSPPSPVLDLPPSWFMAMARVSCASWEMEPYDMAPVENRLTISETGSTSSIGIGCAVRT